MPYFDATDESHLALLPPGQREAPGLDTLAEIVEADIVRVYTQRDRDITYTNTRGYERSSTEIGTDSGIRVFLLGYAADPDNVDSTKYPNFVADFRRTVAGVISWRLQQAKRGVGVASEMTPGGISRTFRPDVDRPFPPGWDRWLRTYDNREPTWGI